MSSDQFADEDSITQPQVYVRTTEHKTAISAAHPELLPQSASTRGTHSLIPYLGQTRPLFRISGLSTAIGLILLCDHILAITRQNWT